MAIDTTYYLKPGETIDAYNSRISTYNASKTGTATPTASTSPTTSAIPMSGGYIAQPAPSPVTTLSSTQGQTLVNTNTQNLQKLETPYTTAPTATPSVNVDSTTGARTLDAATYDQNPLYLKPGESPDQYNTRIAALRNPTGSPAVQSIVDSVNSAIGGGNLTSEQVAGLKQVQGIQDMITTAAAKARLAMESGDYSSMDSYVKQAQAAQQQYTDMLTKYFSDIAPLRQKAADLLTPSAREQALASSLADIRNQEAQFKLQTEEDKFNEFGGQTLGFAGGRAAEIDRKAQFKLSRMALDENNLLTQLGLEQEARKMQSESIDRQLGYLSDDFDLQQKVQDRLQQMEEDFFTKANELKGDAKSTLGTILDNLQGVDPSTLSPDSQKNLEQLAAQAGLPFDLVLQGMQTAYLKSVAENAAKTTDQKLIEVSGGSTLYDPNTGKAIYTAPKVAAPGSGGGDSGGGGTPQPSSADIKSLKDALSASKFEGAEADGKYADPNLYLANYNSWVDSGGDPEEFFRLFPPSTYINPDNTWLPDEIMKFTKKTTSSGGSDNPFE